ncbi:MAG: ribonuclease HII [Alphaproteobacteria bacterium]
MSRVSSATDSFLPDNSPDRPTDFFERRARRRGAEWVAGVDEVGRGPLAGPVVVAAVMFDGRRFPRGLNDSKMLDPDERDRLYEKILSRGLVAVVSASRERVDRMNVLHASLWAMSKAIRALPQPPDHVLVDGNMVPPGLPCNAEALVGGDGRSVSIAAASIVAKVTRDRLMRRVGQAFPEYGFAQHKGYSTPAHFAALSKHGPCWHHRRSFAPIRRRLAPMPDAEATLWDDDKISGAAP